MKQNKLRLPGAAPKDRYKFRTAYGEIYDYAGEAIFPIMKQYSNGQYELIGTGFYISREGLFLTAQHVIQDVIDNAGTQNYYVCIFHFQKNDNFIIRPILRAWNSDVSDLSLGVAAPMTHNQTNESLFNKTVPLSFKKLEIGDEIVTYAYPNVKNSNNGTNQYINFSPEFYDGHIEEYYPNGRDRALITWPCYRTSMHIHNGASGGPVFSKYGVSGINCSSLTHYENTSFVTVIDDLINAYVEGAADSHLKCNSFC